MKRRSAMACLGLALAMPALSPALAEESEAERAERWADLKRAVFGDRPVQEGTGVIALDAPARSELALPLRRLRVLAAWNS